MTQPIEPHKITTYTATAGSLYARRYIARKLVSEIGILYSFNDMVTNDLVTELTLRVAQTEYIERTNPITYPPTWWDALKARWCPEWLRRYVTIRMKTIYTRQVYMCPHLGVGDKETHLKWLCCQLGERVS